MKPLIFRIKEIPSEDIKDQIVSDIKKTYEKYDPIVIFGDTDTIESVLNMNDIKNEILYTDSIFRYIKDQCPVPDSNGGEIDLGSKHAVIMGYIKMLKEIINTLYMDKRVYMSNK